MDPLFERRELTRNVHIQSKFLQKNMLQPLVTQLRMNLEGHCSSCMCKLISGDVEMLNNLALTDKEVENGYILTCQSYAKSDIEIDFD